MHSRDVEAGKIEVRLFGPFAVSGVHAAVPRKGQALLAYLCRRAGFSAPRETLVGLLWSDSPDDLARASLRQTLSVMKKHLDGAGHAVLQADAGAVSLSHPHLWVDTAAFDRMTDTADPDQLRDAVSLVRGDFLEGFGPLSPEFDRWAEAERAQLQAQCATVLLRLCDGAMDAGDLVETIAIAQRLLLVDPLQEQVHRRLMRAYAAQKRYDAALRQFETLKTILAADLGVSPEAETVQLAKDIRRQRGTPPLVQPPPRPPLIDPPCKGRPSVAVLALKTHSSDPDTRFFGEALAEEIIVELARDKSLLVVSGGSSFRFDLDQTAASDIGERLNVRFLLGGSVRMSGDDLRVTVHLVQCDTGQTIWSERHDRTLQDIFRLQTDIARTVTATVVGRIVHAEAEASRHRPFESLESHSLAAQGTQHFMSYSAEGYAAAIHCFDRAVARDPDFARAHGMLSLIRIYQRWYFEMRNDVADLLAPAHRALQLDPRDAKGHCALGVGHLVLRDFDRAGRHFQAGLDANPNDDLLLIEHGRYLMYLGRPQDGLDLVAEAMRLNPFHPNWYWNIQGRCLHMLGRCEEAIQAFQRIHQPIFWVNAYLAACYRILGEASAAKAARQALFDARPDFDLRQFTDLFPYKDPQTARRFFQEIGGID